MDRIIAERYAIALFSLAKEKDCVESYGEQIQLVLDTIQNDDEFLKILNHPQISGEDKLGILSQAFGKSVSEDIMGLFAVILHKNRENELVDIMKCFQEQVQKFKGITVATVESAIPLAQDKLEEIKQKLSKNLNKQVEVEARVVPELIGGLKIHVDGHVIDSTVKKHIDTIRKQLLATKLA